MKKIYFSHALLALALTACVPSYAAQAAQKQREKSQIARKRFDESIARIKKCVRRDCSKMEALKAARDVTLAVIALYVGGTAIQRARSETYLALPASAQGPFVTVTRPIGVAAEAARTPGLMVKETAEQVGGATKAGYHKAKSSLGY